MAQMPMQMANSGTVKMATESFTSSATGIISFPTDRRVLWAFTGTNASNSKMCAIRPLDDHDSASCFITRTGVEAIGNSTTYSLNYTYILNED